MGEAKRRARAQLQNGLEEIQAEGQGVFSLEVYDAVSIMSSLLDPMVERSKRDKLCNVLQAVVVMIELHEKRPEEPTTLCMTCDHEFTTRGDPPGGVIVVNAAVDKAQQGIVSLLCQPCYRRPDARKRILAVLRDNAIPGLREVSLSTPGRA